MASFYYTGSVNPFRDFARLAATFSPAVSAPQAGVDLIKSGDDQYEVVLAVPGFAQDELTLSVENGVLTVRGEPKAAPKAADDGERSWLYRGIARGQFERSFSLAEHVQVRDAALKDGLLRIQLVREVPEALKPRTIAINQPAALPAAA
jgi:molecular chaperone IbpA